MTYSLIGNHEAVICKLVEAVDEHDVAILLVDFGVEEIATVGRDGQAIGEILIYSEEFADLFRSCCTTQDKCLKELWLKFRK